VAQWAGMSTGKTRDSRVADAEASLRRAISALVGADPAHRQSKAKNVSALAKSVLSARVRRLKAVLNESSEQRRTGYEKYSPAEVAAQRKNLEELQRSGVEAVLKEFGVAVTDLGEGALSNKSLERTRGDFPRNS
jgi:hypothetical protein